MFSFLTSAPTEDPVVVSRLPSKYAPVPRPTPEPVTRPEKYPPTESAPPTVVEALFAAPYTAVACTVAVDGWIEYAEKVAIHSVSAPLAHLAAVVEPVRDNLTIGPVT